MESLTDFVALFYEKILPAFKKDFRFSPWKFLIVKGYVILAEIQQITTVQKI